MKRQATVLHIAKKNGSFPSVDLDAIERATGCLAQPRELLRSFGLMVIFVEVVNDTQKKAVVNFCKKKGYEVLVEQTTPYGTGLVPA